jgi:DNA-binding response OmpR family regulator
MRSGLEVGGKATRNVPVVVLSADATGPHIDRLLAQGAAAYLTKPIGVHELLRVVDHVLGTHRSPTDPDTAPAADQPTTVPADPPGSGHHPR